MKRKAKGTNAAAWFYGQSFHGPRLVPPPVAPDGGFIEMDEALAAESPAKPACEICDVMGELCCTEHGAEMRARLKGLGHHAADYPEHITKARFQGDGE